MNNDVIKLAIKNQRVQIPDTYDVQPDSTLIITSGFESCLMLFKDDDVWQHIRKVLTQSNEASKAQQALVRLIIGNAEDLAISAIREIHVSDHLLACLEGDVQQHHDKKNSDHLIWVTCERHVELWSPAQYKTRQEHPAILKFLGLK
jgi:DNA-binding transcriptional regulator/RsmH inhibitor MraZ